MGTQPNFLIQVCSQVIRSPAKYMKTAYISGLLWLQMGQLFGVQYLFSSDITWVCIS